MQDTISELLRFFEKIDSIKRWSIEPDEAVEITLANANEYLVKEKIDDYIVSVTQQLGGIGYERLGDKVVFSLSGKEEQNLYAILKNSEFFK